MTPDEAYDVLSTHLSGPGTGTPLEAAWRCLDAALRADGSLPERWERLTSGAAADRAGKDQPAWSDLVAKGYAPPPDGHDHAGRAWWHPATIDAWRSGGWTPAPRPRDPTLPPPGNASGGMWRLWALAREVPGITEHTPRETVIARCREAGVL